MLKKYILILSIIFGSFLTKAQNPYAEKQVKALSKWLESYQAIDPADWRYLSCDSCVKPGERSSLVRDLRNNLLLTGDLSEQANNVKDRDLFDSTIKKSLVKFQQRHGLNSDGILDSKTIDAMNVPFVTRVETIKRNILKWEEFSADSNASYILVNIPDYYLSVIEEGENIFQLKVIVGRYSHKTPLLKSHIKYVVFNPTWVVPRSISVKEILPVLKSDPEYLQRNNMNLYSYENGIRVTVDPDTIDWKYITKSNYNFQIEQTSGHWNAFGEIKFQFDNTYNVYLHDTPEKRLFNHEIRTYSHGCVRVDNPEFLASYLLDREISDIEKLLEKGISNQYVKLKKPFPIYLEYFTCWVDNEGNLNFREDIYDKYTLNSFSGQ